MINSLLKEKIDATEHGDLLMRFLLTPASFFQTETGQYFVRVMQEKWFQSGGLSKLAAVEQDRKKTEGTEK